MEINITIKTEDETAMAAALDIALFRLGKQINQIIHLKVDESIDLPYANGAIATVSRSE